MNRSIPSPTPHTHVHHLIPHLIMLQGAACRCPGHCLLVSTRIYYLSCPPAHVYNLMPDFITFLRGLPLLMSLLIAALIYSLSCSSRTHAPLDNGVDHISARPAAAHVTAHGCTDRLTLLLHPHTCTSRCVHLSMRHLIMSQGAACHCPSYHNSHGCTDLFPLLLPTHTCTT